jgi:hypothetical protein
LYRYGPSAEIEADEDELARELEGLIKEEEEDFKENVRAKEAQDQESELSQRMAALKPTSESPSPSEASERAKSTILQEEQTPGADPSPSCSLIDFGLLLQPAFLSSGSFGGSPGLCFLISLNFALYRTRALFNGSR